MQTISKGYKVAIDIIADKRTAIQQAYRLNLTTVYDIEYKNTIQLPSPQKSGTLGQQRLYITSVLDRLCN